MAILKQIVKDILPVNNSKNITVDTSFKIVFTESLDEDTLANFVYIKESNGEKLEAIYTYTGVTKTLHIKPNVPLKNSKRIELIIKGGKDGIKTIYENTIEKDITYFYETIEIDKSEDISVPKNIKVITNGFYISIDSDKKNADGINYKICDSNSNPVGIYPENGELEIALDKFDVPKKFDEGIYYLWIRSLYVINNKKEYSDFEIVSFEIKEEDILPNIFNLSLVKSYPSNQEIINNLDMFGFEFSEQLDDINEHQIVINEKVDNDFKNLLFKNNEKITINSTDDKILKLSLDEPENFKKGIRYLIKLKDTIKGISGNTLGQDNDIEFLILPDRFYTSIHSVRIILGQFSSMFSDIDIMELISDTSNSTYSRFKDSTNFKEEEWANNSCPYYVAEYVKFKVVYLLILNNILKTASGSGKDIKLADLEVAEKNMASTELKDLLAFLKDELDKWETEMDENTVKLKFAKGVTATRGSANEYTSEYPTGFTRNPYKGLGGS